MTTPEKTDDDKRSGKAESGTEKSGKLKRGRAPRGRKAKPEAAPEPAAESPRGVESRPTFKPEPAPQPAPPPPQAPAASTEPAPSASAPEQRAQRDEREEQPAPSQGDGRQQQPSNGQGEWQERGFWKRNKRKRGRFGNWQGGPERGPERGPQHPHHPPQPQPPSQAPVYGDLPDPARFADLAALDALAAEISSGPGPQIALDELYAKHLADLMAYAREIGVAFEGAPNRKQLITLIFATAAEKKIKLVDRGYMDVTDRGAFIVHEHVNYRLYPENSYLPDSLVRRYGLKRGHRIAALVQVPQGNDRCPSVLRVDEVMGHPPEDISKVVPFEELVPYYPLKRILLEAPDIQKDVSMRAVDILTPIGFGQRGLIVAPPRTGKTILLQNIANSISENSPETKLILLLVDERPEEVTDFRRHTKGEVVSSTFDESPESHIHCAEMVGEKARRLVEQGEHVVILLDSITRLARAYNALASNQGKIMSGGLEATALQKPKRFFGAARNIEGAGSLTIIGTALVDTGSRMDEIIFEEFKGTGNMELHLDRGLVERRVFPAINIDRSGTRKEELIYHPEELQRIFGLRRAMQGLGPIESMEMLIQRLKKTKSNAEFLLTLSRQ